MYSSECPICKRERTYKTKQGYEKGLLKPCVSCSNSLCRGGIGNVNSIDDIKVCACCKQSKHTSEYFYYENKKRYHSICNDCKKEKFKHYQKTKGRFDKYGITKEDYDEMYQSQNGTCYICNTSYDVLCIDHNHKTKAVRKLLCKNCNTAYGLLKENIKTIENLLNYARTE